MSNFDDERVNDIVVAENMTLYWANKIFKDSVEAEGTEQSMYFFKVVPQERELYVWSP